MLLIMVLAGFLTRTWTRQGIVSYLAVWCLFFAWCRHSAQRSAPLAMWVAANCGRPLYGTFRRGGAWNRLWTAYWVWMMANTFGAFGGLARSFPSGSTTEMWVSVAAVLWVLLFMVATRKYSNAMAEPLVGQMRLIAQEPLPELNDPRFKQWKDIRTRFPAPIGGRFGHPVEDLLQSEPIRAAGAWFWRPIGRACGLACGRLQKAAVTRGMRKMR